MTKKKVHFLVGTRWFGVLGPCTLIIDALVEGGYDVFVFGQRDEHYHRYDLGKARLIEINMSRSYFSFLSDFCDIVKLIYYVLRYKPSGIHSFNPKPALLAWAAASVRSETKFFIGVTGLGNTFIRARQMQPLIRFLLKKACKRASSVFFQNTDDVAMFQDSKLVASDKIKLFIGPGVDLRIFRPAEEKYSGELNMDEIKNKITVACTARLIWQKGIREYVEAARLVKEHYSSDRNIEFLLIGEIDRDHPDCVDEQFLQEVKASKLINHISWTDNIVEVLNQVDIFVLHSYREGAPRAILEASSLCIPTIGADAIGVRELVVDGETGYLTPLREVEPIFDAIVRLIDDPAERKSMGLKARQMIAEPLSLTRSSDAQMEMYREVGYLLPNLVPDQRENFDNNAK